MKIKSKAHCHICNKLQNIEWKPIDKRGKEWQTWFKCEVCGKDKLKYRYMEEL